MNPTARLWWNPSISIWDNREMITEPAKSVCAQCEQEFNATSRHKKCPKCRGTGYSVCECGNRKTRNAKTCKVCMTPMTQERNPNWRGGRTTHRKGYISISVPGHPRASNGYVFEHILVMEEILGRYMRSGENVHHKNGVKDDNSPGNLELWVKPQPSGIKIEDAIAWANSILNREYGTYFSRGGAGNRTPGPASCP